MTARLNWTSGPLEVPQAQLNPGRGEPFVVISFADSWMALETPEECETWAAAFIEAARLLREAGASAEGLTLAEREFQRSMENAQDRDWD